MPMAQGDENPAGGAEGGSLLPSAGLEQRGGAQGRQLLLSPRVLGQGWREGVLATNRHCKLWFKTIT